MMIKRTKLINTSRVMREIWTSRETTRIDISRALGLDKSTVSAIVSDLLDLGVIMETREGSAGPHGGRRPVHITLNRGYGCVLGIELRPESYTAVGVDLTGDVVFSRFEKMRISGTNVRERILEILGRLDGERGRCGLPVLGLGVGLSGVVDPDVGLVKYSIPLQVESPINLYECMKDDLDVPFFIENDANACAWGELAFHRHRDLRDFIFVLVELRDLDRITPVYEKTAVGFGIVIDARVHHGATHSAGEFRSIMRKEGSRGQFSLDGEMVLRIEEEPVIMDRFITELSKHIALFVNTFNLGHVFVGSNLDLNAGRVREILSREIQANWPYPDRVSCEIAFSSLGDRAVAYGAAGMVLERMFADLEIRDGLADLREKRKGLLHGWPAPETV